MKFFIAILVVCAAGSLTSAEDVSNVAVELDVISIRNLTEYLIASKENVNVVELNRFDLSRAQIRYTLGSRCCGDRIVATNSANQQWASAQDVALTLAYPKSGIGSVVTFVDITVDQSSSLGRGYIVAGGVGQRRITVVIEAYSTTRFQYGASFFGY